MPPVARKSGTEPVDTVHVSVGDANPLDDCACDAAPQIIGTDVGSGDVFANSIGVVRAGDAVQPHTFPCDCALHAPGLASFSGTVFANGKNIGRQGDVYGCGALILSGSGNVFAGG
jgi:uncharacterized Zn-binding protein involved in type VI secretion